MQQSTILKSVIFATVAATAAIAQPTASGYLDVFMVRVKPDKRPQFDAVAKRVATANRQHKGDNWVAYETVYGESDLVYFVSIRNDFAGIDEGQKAFMSALGAGAGTMLAEMDSYAVNSRSEIRTRRPDLSSNLPADIAALNAVVGKARYLRIVTVRVRPGKAEEFEAELRAIKQAQERQMPGAVSTVSQSGVGQALGTYYITNFGATIAQLQPPKNLPELLGSGGYRRFSDVAANTTTVADIIIARWLPELSNPPEAIASADPAFWNPKPAPAPRAKPAAKQ
jgi:hypothetical protein